MPSPGRPHRAVSAWVQAGWRLGGMAVAVALPVHVHAAL